MANIRECFQQGMSKVAAVGLAIGYPVAPAVPHMYVNAFRNLVALSIECPDIDFKEAAEIKVCVGVLVCVCVSSCCCYICVLMLLLYMCPHTTTVCV